jgi:uncharacterized protein RhaS with RHS repeats
MQQRYYDPQIGRFLSRDPDPVNTVSPWNFNRYSYAANNPYKFADPDGRVVHVAGAAADQQTLIDQVASASGLVVTQDASGNLQSSQCSMDQSSASVITAAALMGAIDASSTISMTAVSASPSVFGDSYESGQVDVADLSGLAEGSPAVAAAIITHILVEYQTAQEMPGGQIPSNFEAAHDRGASVEAKIFGAVTRTNSSPEPARALSPGGQINFNYKDGSGAVMQSFSYRNDSNATPHP